MTFASGPARHRESPIDRGPDARSSPAPFPISGVWTGAASVPRLTTCSPLGLVDVTPSMTLVYVAVAGSAYPRGQSDMTRHGAAPFATRPSPVTARSPWAWAERRP